MGREVRSLIRRVTAGSSRHCPNFPGSRDAVRILGGMATYECTDCGFETSDGNAADQHEEEQGHYVAEAD